MVWRPCCWLTCSSHSSCTLQCWLLALVALSTPAESPKFSEQPTKVTDLSFGSKWRSLSWLWFNQVDFSFNPDPTVRHTWSSVLIGSTATYLTLYAVNQAQVQRLLTVKDLKSAQKAVWLNWPILSFLSLTTSFCGLVMYYYYRKCDPLAQGRISSFDQSMPIYVIDGEIF